MTGLTEIIQQPLCAAEHYALGAAVDAELRIAGFTSGRLDTGCSLSMPASSRNSELAALPWAAAFSTYLWGTQSIELSTIVTTFWQTGKPKLKII